MGVKTRGEYEAEFTREMTRIEKEFLGRGPHEVRTFFLDDMIIVRLRGILTPAETKLIESSGGRELIKDTRRKLFEGARPLIEQAVRDILACNVISMHTDISTKTGERILVLTVDRKLGQVFN
jgi:uncharacterized protein YbcI